jgi:hypothetical protein
VLNRIRTYLSASQDVISAIIWKQDSCHHKAAYSRALGGSWYSASTVGITMRNIDLNSGYSHVCITLALFSFCVHAKPPFLHAFLFGAILVGERVLGF